MNLKFLNRTQLDQRMKSLAAREREILHDILLTIKEIDSRKLYLEMGYPNLFAYLVEAIGYSAGSAQRRIEAARLLKELPEIGEKIESGLLNLSQISVVQKAVREIKHSSQIQVSAQDKREILGLIEHKTQLESQKVVAQFFELPLLQETHIKPQSDESVRLSITISKELYDKIQKAQGLLSHHVDSDILSYLEYVTDKVIESKLGKQSLGEAKVSAENVSSKQFTSIVEVKSKNTFSHKTKQQVLKEQKCCQYIDPFTKKQCGSYWFLEVDHKQSVWAHGDNQRQNAQLLCAQHNQLKYRRESGMKWIS